jgi:hypothetical protein
LNQQLQGIMPAAAEKAKTLPTGREQMHIYKIDK